MKGSGWYRERKIDISRGTGWKLEKVKIFYLKEQKIDQKFFCIRQVDGCIGHQDKKMSFWSSMR